MQGPLQIAGVVILNAGGSATGTLNWNDLREERRKILWLSPVPIPSIPRDVSL